MTTEKESCCPDNSADAVQDNSVDSPPARRANWLSSSFNQLAVGTLALGFLFCFYAIGWGLPDKRSSAPDNMVVDGYAAHRGANLAKAMVEIYPPVVYLQMELVFKPLRMVINHFEEDLSGVTIASAYIIAARAISALLTLGTAIAVFYTATQVFDKYSGLVAASLYLFNPVTLYYAHTSNCEATYIFYFALTIFFFSKSLNDEKKPYHWPMLFCISGALCVASKDQGFFLLVGPSLWLLYKQKQRFLLAAIPGAILYLLTFVMWDGFALFIRHVQSMREICNASRFYQYTNSPVDLLLLSGHFLAETVGVAIVPAALLACIPFLLWQKVVTKPTSWQVPLQHVMIVLIPYFISILFLAHRTHLRFTLPLLPMLAIPPAWAICQLIKQRKFRLWGTLPLLLVLTMAVLFLVHLQGNPRDTTKQFIRTLLTENKLPQGARMALFSLRRGSVFSVNDQGKWVKKVSNRDWTQEKFGYLDGVTLCPLRSEQFPLIEQHKLELIIVCPEDEVPDSFPNYSLLGNFTPPFNSLFSRLTGLNSYKLYARGKWQGSPTDLKP